MGYSGDWSINIETGIVQFLNASGTSFAKPDIKSSSGKITQEVIAGGNRLHNLAQHNMIARQLCMRQSKFAYELIISMLFEEGRPLIVLRPRPPTSCFQPPGSDSELAQPILLN